MTPLICAPPAVDRFASRLMAETDCQAMGIVERGYEALAQPGSSVATALTGLMVMSVAFFGYRLLLGRGLALTDAVSLTVKLGIVLMLATSWASWQALAFDGVARAPSQIASDMLVGIGAPPPIESLENGLDNLTAATSGYRSRAGIASPLVGGPAAAGAVLNLSAVLLTLSTVGIVIAAKVVLAILLAIAPAMAGFFLFDATRGVAIGWLTAIVTMAIAPAFALLVAAIEFTILTPMIARLMAEQAAGIFENAAVMPIGLVTVVFLIALFFALRSGAQIARGLMLPTNKATGSQGRSVYEAKGTDRTATIQTGKEQAAPRLSRTLEAMAHRDALSQQANAGRFVTPASASAPSRDRSRISLAPRENHGFISFSRKPQPMRHATRRSRAAARRDA